MTRKVYRSLVVLTVVLVAGWGVNSSQRLMLTAMGVDSLGQFIVGIFANYLGIAGTGVNGPVLYAFRSVHLPVTSGKSTVK